MREARGRVYLRGKELQLTLQILHAGVTGGEVDPEVVWQLLSKQLPVLLKAQVSGRRRGASVQLLTLQLLEALRGYLSSPLDMLPLLEPSATHSLLRIFPKHPSRSCRDAFYTIIIALWDQTSSSAASSSSRGSAGAGAGSSLSSSSSASADMARLRSLLRTSLLGGLLDSDKGIRDRVYAFWNSENRLSRHIDQRLGQLMSSLFDPTPGGLRPWLHYAAPLLLGLRSRGEDFFGNTRIFSQPLKAVDFVDLAVSTAGGGATGTMRPLFSQAYAPGAGGSSMGSQWIADSQQPQNLEFSLTQAPGAGAGGRHKAAARSAYMASFAPDPATYGTFVATKPAHRGGGGADIGSLGTFASVPASASLASLSSLSASQGDVTSAGAAAAARSPGVKMQRLMLDMRVGAPSWTKIGGGAGGLTQGALTSISVTEPVAPHPAHQAAAQQQEQLVSGGGGRSAATQRLFESFVPVRVSAARGGTVRASTGTQVGAGSAASQAPVATSETTRFADAAVARREQQLSSSVRQRAGRAMQGVRLMRRYRKGDVPDVQIPVSALVLPLQQLCEVDVSVATAALEALFLHVYSDALDDTAGGAGAGSGGHHHHYRSRHHRGLDSSQGSTYISKPALRRGLQSMLSLMQSTAAAITLGAASRMSVTPVVALLQRLTSAAAAQDLAASAASRVAMEAFPVPPALIGSGARSAMSYAGGIRLLEDGLRAHGAGAGTASDTASSAAPASASADADASSSGSGSGAVVVYGSPSGVPIIPDSAGTANEKIAEHKSFITAASLTAYNRRPPQAAASPKEVRSAWVQLQELYAAIGDEDVVSGLLNLTATAKLRKAVLQEMNGDLEAAISVYNEALTESHPWRVAQVVEASPPSAPSQASLPSSSSSSAPPATQQQASLMPYDDEDDFAAALAEDEPMTSVAPPVRPSSSSSSSSFSSVHNGMDVAEALAWDSRRDRCLATLEKWPAVQYAVAIVAATGEPPMAVQTAEEPPAAPALDKSSFRRLDPHRQSLLLTSFSRQALDQLSSTGFAVAAKSPYVSGILEFTGGGSSSKRSATSDVATQPLQGVTGLYAASQLRLLSATAHIMTGSLVPASTAVNEGLAALPSLYASLSPLAIEARARSLMLLQPLVETREFLSFATSVANVTASGADSAVARASKAQVLDRIPGMLTSWRGRAPSGLLQQQSTDTLSVWDAVLAGRRLFFSRVAEFAQVLQRSHSFTDNAAGGEMMELGKSMQRAMFAQASSDARQLGVKSRAQQLFTASHDPSLNTVTNILNPAGKLVAAPLISIQQRRLVTDLRHKAAELYLEAGDVSTAATRVFSAANDAVNAMNAFKDVVVRASLTDTVAPIVNALGPGRVSNSDLGAALHSHYVFDLQLLYGETASEFVRFALTNDDAGSKASALPKAVSDSLTILSYVAHGKLFDQSPVAIEIKSAGRGGSSGAPISLARYTAAKQAHASLLLGRYSNALLQHLEASDDPIAAGAGAGTGSSSSSSGNSSNVGALVSQALSNAAQTRESLAETVTQHVLAALRADPQGSGAARGADLASALGVSPLVLARTGTFDDCGLSAPSLASSSSSTDSPVMMIPRVLDLISTHESARAVFAAAVQSGQLPLYSFLPWIPQLFALLQPRFVGASGAVDAAGGGAVSSAKVRGGGRGGSTAAASSSSSSSSSFVLGRGAAEAASVLAALARAYPQAVYYPFRISTAESSGDSTVMSPSDISKQQALLASIKSALHSPLLDCFVRALEDLHSPEMKFADWLKAVRQEVTAHATRVGKRDAELPPEAQRAWYNDLQQRCLGGRELLGGNAEAGAQVSRWVTMWERPITSILRNGASVTRKAIAELEALRDGKKNSPKEPLQNQPAPRAMSDLSHWLDTFSASDHAAGSVIEVPGQYERYSGRSRPDPSSHAYIVSCDARVRTMGSMRRPKRISFIAQNERSYPFLAKGGEDIRADQRVEQLFNVINAVLAADRGCRGRDLRIRTYAVVPITPHIGLIEWVDNTAPLKALIEDAANARLQAAPPVPGSGGRRSGPLPKWTFDHNDAQNARNKWYEAQALACNTQLAHDFETYRWIHASVSPLDAGRAWESVMMHAPPDLLRSHLAGMAPSPEGFLAVRANFAKTLAVFSAAGYILGIGDRHLENFLLDGSTGGILPIDFGAVFGFATTSLPVPELIPFRMTPQFLSVMAPLPTEALLKTHMTSVLRALGEAAAKRTVLTVLEVFALEPTLDWQSQARTRTNTSRELSAAANAAAAGAERGASEDAADDASQAGAEVWYPRAKILVAKLKLERVSPSALMFLDLLQNGRYGRPFAAQLATKGRKGKYDFDGLIRNMHHTIYGAPPPTATTGGSSSSSSSALVRSSRGAAAATTLPVAWRSAPEHNRDYRLRRSDQRLLEAAIGGPLSGNSSALLDVTLTASPSPESHVDCMMDLATDPNVLVRQWTGLATHW